LDELRALLIDSGASLVGCADLSGVPDAEDFDFPYAVSIAVALDPRVIAGVSAGPTKDYFAEYKHTNYTLNALATVAAESLRGRGYAAWPFAAAHGVIDRVTLSARFPHKTAATRAGLGWIGKCALLVTPEFGSAVRLTTVLTDAPLSLGTPVTESRCGACSLCVDACPGKAPKGPNWKVGLHRDEFFDAKACLAAMRETSARTLGSPQTVCGICVAACTWTGNYLRRAGAI
jgi:epoxyqueuosine reductase QueG